MSKAIKDAPAFDFYPERWTHGTRHMSKVERCDYLDLLAHQWTDDGLPADLDVLARLIGYKKGAQIPALVLEKFPVAADGKRRNVRLESERQAQRNRIARKRAGATKTNAKRWGSDVANESLSDHSATDLRVDIESPPPTTHHPPQRERENASAPDLDRVEQIVAAYPLQDAPMECRESVRMALDSGEDPQRMLAAVQACTVLIRLAPGGPSNRFVPTARSFFQREEWRSPEKFQKLNQPTGKSNPSPTAHQAKPPGLFGSSMDKYRTDKPKGES